MRTLLITLGALALLPIAAVATIVLGMRYNVRPILDAVRRFNRAVTNPRALGSAENEESTRTVVRHVGRRSGKAYETPVDAFDTGRDTLLVALPYGPDTDWVRNITAAGGADVLRRGREFTVTAPRVVATAEVVDELPASLRRTLRLFNVENCLELRVA
ncbi:nitroreductase family deazaflavin-dependent oxidoreductase [Tsukamurella strandjordii]|uniref:nitroreductase family deazaflavin-dependent oxidoreductase n=1 Tax=Tsukamurella TaxID=2060 RepID=UPI001C7DC7F5|nr:nitroreductase family deazaflavin-dependent oxidoreductase [Tsukamurella sp. TY48]GIZ95735.1 hypothetical protein TTY48_03470 [Tsukamurella sp. TY48]